MNSKSKNLRAFASSRETKKEEAKPALVPKLYFTAFPEIHVWHAKPRSSEEMKGESNP